MRPRANFNAKLWTVGENGVPVEFLCGSKCAIGVGDIDKGEVMHACGLRKRIGNLCTFHSFFYEPKHFLESSLLKNHSLCGQCLEGWLGVPIGGNRMGASRTRWETWALSLHVGPFLICK
jgi:hypothetical protein